MEMQDRKIKE